MRAFRLAAATTAALMAAAFASPAHAQQDQSPAPPKPYQPVAVSAPAPMNDPSFEAFRKQIADIVKRKDKAALTRLVVARNFFWEGETGDNADKKKSGVDNLATAIGLNAPDGSGWDILAAYASNPTAQPLSGRTGVVCGPAGPKFDEKALEALVKSTDTDISEWGYPLQAGTEVRANAHPNSAVVEKLGMNFVRVYPDSSPAAAINAPNSIRIVLPSGKTGYIAMEAIAPLASDQLCYAKDGGAWKIAGFVGVGDQQ